MSEIKFRVWDVREKKWASSSCISIEGFDEFLIIGNLGKNFFKLMQFTGLKDKNGKEIYSGDFLEWAGKVLPVTINYEHGIRAMWGEDNICRAYAIDGEVVGNEYEDLQNHGKGET